MADDNFPRAPRYPFTRSNASSDSLARGPSSDRAHSNDPLSELARLIGQTDPFADAAPPAPPPSPPSQRTLREILRGARDNPYPDSRLREPPPSNNGFARQERWNGHSIVPSSESAPPPLVPDIRDHFRSDTLRNEPSSDDSFRDPPYQDEESGYSANGYEDHAGEPPSAGYEEREDDPALQSGQAPSQDPHDDFSGYDDQQEGPYYGDDGQLLPEDPYASPLPQDEIEPHEQPRKRGGLLTVAAVLGLAVLGTAGAYAYRTFFSGAPGFPPLIRADSTPNKIVPAQSESGSSKQIYDRVGGDGAQSEKVVSREEQPVDINAAGARSPNANASGAQPSSPPGATTLAWPTPSGAQPAQPAMNGGRAQNAPSGANEPRKVRTIPIRADGQGGALPSAAPPPPPAPQTAAPASAPPAPMRTAAAVPTEPSPPPTRPASTRVSNSNGPLSLSPRAADDDAPAAQAPRSLAAVTPRAVTPSSVGQGGYVVQLSAQRSQEEATASFHSFQARYPSILGGQQMLIRRKEISGKGTFFGAQVGPFETQAEAAQLCTQLKSAGGTCIVQKN
jgi:hypothetical protein